MNEKIKEASARFSRPDIVVGHFKQQAVKFGSSK